MHKDIREENHSTSIFKKAFLNVCGIACAILFAAFLTSCTSQQIPSDTDEQTVTASEYMVMLNQAADSLRENLNDFAAAVNAGDLSTLQTKADTAFQAMDSLDDLKTPDELTGVRDQYKEAINVLHNSLNEYIAVFTEIENEPDQANIDLGKYAERFENIQKEYDNGMNLLEKADSAAKEL